MSLWALLVRHALHPLHEAALRRPTHRGLRTLHDLNACAPTAVAADQTARLADLLAFARRHLPHFRESLAAGGTTDDPRAALARLTPLTKDIIRAAQSGLTWPGVPGGPLPYWSGGTTGNTLAFHIDRQRQADDLSARLFVQSWFGVEVGDRRVHVWGSPREAAGSRVKAWRDRLLNERILDAFDLAPARLAEHLATLRRYRPALIYGYPTALARLAQFAATCSQPAEFTWLRVVVLTGEEVSADQVAQVRAAFGCAVAEEYGSREVGLVAHSCPHGNLHLITPHNYVEILVDGAVAPRDTVGEIVCTTLNTRAQPFVRYRMGDLGALRSDACPCGRPFPLLRLAGGKVTGFLALPDGRLCHGAVSSHMLRGEVGILQFRTHQRAVDQIDVYLVVSDAFDRSSLARIRARYARLFGPAVVVTCRLVEELPPDPSGKRRHTISDVAPNYASFEIVTPPV